MLRGETSGTTQIFGSRERVSLLLLTLDDAYVKISCAEVVAIASNVIPIETFYSKVVYFSSKTRLADAENDDLHYDVRAFRTLSNDELLTHLHICQHSSK